MQAQGFAEITAYDGDRVIERERRPMAEGGGGVRFAGADWQIELEDVERDARDRRLAVAFRHLSGAPVAAAGGLAWEFNDWSREVYVLLPAGAYAGNRFPAVQVPYSPRVPAELVAGVRTPPLITDVPRLNHGEGPSRLQLKTGDLAFPGFGWFDPRQRRAWFVTAADPVALADALWEIEESPDRTRAVFRVSVAGVRQSPVYRLPWMKAPSPDRARPVRAGERIAIELRVEQWPCADMAGFFDHIFSRRASLTHGQDVPPVLPFSAAFDLIEEHYHRDSWREHLGLFASDCNPGAVYVFQTGWCGGMIATLPLLASPKALTGERVRRNLETFFAQAPRPCGLFYGKRRPDGVWTADFAQDATRPYTHAWTLTRRQADALFYLERQVAWLRWTDPAFAIPEHWTQALDRAAQRFVQLWEAHGQFGQFLHQETGEILVGGSTSGALVPAALVQSWQRTAQPEWLRVAREAGEFFAREFLARGFTTGGPGDALQNPDSESAAALVESYAALHAATGEARWLEHGRAAAALLAGAAVQVVDLSAEAQRAGVVVAPLAEVAAEPFLGTAVPPSHGFLEALNSAVFRPAVAVVVPRRVRLEKPIRLRLVAGPWLFLPRILLVVQEGASVEVVEGHVGGGPGSLVLGVTEAFVGCGAELRYDVVQRWEGGVTGHLTSRVIMEQDS
ncbi:MAG: hypothetical protein RMK20_00630, partial [Verrucomicrobiales bacterium]|nr:hypothetical protein [Verrucomicrobiales bacterium]